VETKRTYGERAGGRLGRCYVCGTTNDRYLSNKLLVVICSRCQRLKNIKDRLRAPRKTPAVDAKIIRILRGQPFDAYSVWTDVTVWRLEGRDMQLILHPFNQGYQVERLRRDESGTYVLEKGFVSA
jgi:hypothetical protein